MPEENSQMDALLKSYAAKRRAEAGEPLEMPPLMRQMLQSEVPKSLAKAKNAPPPEKVPFSFMLWPRLSLGLACLVLFLGLLFWFQPEDETPSASLLADKAGETENLALLDEKRLAGGESAPAPGATVDQPLPLDEPLTATPAKDAALSAAASSPAPVVASSVPEITAEEAAVKTKGDFTFSESKTIASAEIVQPTSPPPSVVEDLQKNRDEAAKEQSVARRAQAESVGKLKAEEAPTSVAVPADGVLAEKKATESDRADATNGRLYFTQENQEKYRQNLLSPPQPEVLTAFQWERVENKIRIIDHDGSVYEGQVQTPVDGDALRKIAPEAKDNFTFLANGTNRELQQMVVFQGSFVLTNLPALPVALAVPGTAGDKSVPVATPILRNGIIQGKVQIGGTNEFEIKARQSAP